MPNRQKLRECAYIGCPEIDAALTMLASDLTEGLVVFLGDYAEFRIEESAFKRILRIVARSEELTCNQC